MADEGEGRRDQRARGGARTWPLGGSRRPWAAAWPRPEFAVPARLREWAYAEVGAGRLLPWFAVAFGAGVVLYFTAEHKPVWWALSVVAAVTAIGAALLRRRLLGFVIALGAFAMAAGFTVATLKAALIEHPVLRYPASSVALASFVELREESQKTDRFMVRLERIEGSRIFEKPQRVRLSVRRGSAPPAGAFVELKAQLNPPLQPLRPGSYNFARDLYFQSIVANDFNGLLSNFRAIRYWVFWLRPIEIADGCQRIIALHRETCIALHHHFRHSDHVRDLPGIGASAA